MHLPTPTPLTRAALLRRRRALLQHTAGRPVLLAAGAAPPRNYAANTYPFRASSHFLYLAALPLEGALLLLTAPDRATLYLPVWDASWALWHGEPPAPDAIAEAAQAELRPLTALEDDLRGLDPLTLPTADLASCAELSRLLQRPITPGQLAPQDLPLADGLIQLRLLHDDAALEGIRSAIDATTDAFKAGMAATRPGLTEAELRATMERPLTARSLTTAYAPILSTQGEVLHNNSYPNTLQAGDLLLADFGAEGPDGWASDVTRTWPVTGRLSSTQRDLYTLVLAALDDAIQAVAPGVRYRDVHLTAARTLTRGLVDLGVLRGDPDAIVEEGAHALLFPHGIGHLLGLDVHDMEDLGDRAGYAPGRQRDPRFGLRWLRLDRELAPGMVVTLEPGLYIVPALLRDPTLAGWVRDHLDTTVLAHFSDVRGIRIEDDILVTQEGRLNLTAHIPRTPEALEEAILHPTPKTRL